MDQLLDELQNRLSAIVTTRDSVHALLDAVVSIGSELELETVLQRIVEAAKSLADCRYAALGVIGEQGDLAEFIPVGMTTDEVEGMAEWPHGRGLLGLLIKEPQVLRLEEISAHPASYGFPPGHPPMRGFLGVPILVRDEVFGNLYLTEKSGGQEFDDQDETIVRALASVAGIAIKNARLYQETRAREVWLDAIAGVTRTLLSGADRREALVIVAERAREMTGAAAAWIALAEGDQLRIEVADGLPELEGVRFPLQGSVSERVLNDQTPVLIAVPSELPSAADLPVEIPGPTLVLPLAPGSDGVLAVARRAGGTPFSTESTQLLTGFCQQLGVVMELAEARRESERYGLIDDRERIGRDLHDVVIQRLYGVAMQLAGAARLTDKPQVEDRIQSAVDNLDDTIRQIRSTIFALQAQDAPAGARLRSRITAIVDQASDQLGFTPALRMAGLLDTDVPDEVAEDVTAVLSECLSNVARHAKASQVDVSVGLTGDGNLEVRVIDNGIGIPPNGRRSGLDNLRRRAVGRAGTFTVAAGEETGTVAIWLVKINGD